MEPAGFGARIVARFADGFLVSIVAAVIGGVAGIDGAGRTVMTAVIGITYETVMVATRSQTIGKQLTKIRVAGLADAPIAPWQALVRAVVVLLPFYLIAPRTDTVGEWLVVVALIANFIVVSMRRDDRRGIHDLVAQTRPVALPAG